MKIYYVYILTNQPRGTLYIGITNDLQRRIIEHREGTVEGFTKKYDLKRLVYFQAYADVFRALAREKQLKRWHRDWKINLIEEQNNEWVDLYKKIFIGMDPETSSG